MFDGVRMFGRYALGLRTFLKRPLTPAECRQRVERQLRTRDDSFLRLVERGVFGNPSSPYQKLLTRAGVEFADVATLVRKDGIEATLEKLHGAGVYVTHDEFKGRRPLERSGLTVSLRPRDFDNPLLAKHYEGRTGGSRGVGTRIVLDFDLLTHEAAHSSLFRTAFALEGKPIGVWLPVPPAVSGLKHVLRAARFGCPAERWFTQTRLTLSPDSLKYFLFTSYAVYGSRLVGRALPRPEYVPLEEARRVADWLAAKTRAGTPAELQTTPSAAVRVCLAAREHGSAIAGTFFRVNGEPYTEARAKLVAEAGGRAGCQYSMAEIGNIGSGCATPMAPDDVHVLSDKVAVIQRETPVGHDGMSVQALLYTTVLPSCPKLMLNVESADYGVLANRVCACPLGEMGFDQHLYDIRSYDKLTSEGMTFLGSELVALVEDILPARFGGHPTDYQFVEEEEEEGLPKISVIVSPRVGRVSEAQLVTTVLARLQTYPGAKRMMANLWRDAKTLRVVRREPHATRAAKILPLHILRQKRPAG